jgi:hypothetical protein
LERFKYKQDQAQAKGRRRPTVLTPKQTRRGYKKQAFMQAKSLPLDLQAFTVLCDTP